MNKVEYIKEQRRINAKKKDAEKQFAIEQAKLYVQKEEKKALDYLLEKVTKSFMDGYEKIRISPRCTNKQFPINREYPENIVEQWTYADVRYCTLSMSSTIGVSEEINSKYADMFFSLFVVMDSFPKVLEEEGFIVEWKDGTCYISMPE